MELKKDWAMEKREGEIFGRKEEPAEVVSLSCTKGGNCGDRVYNGCFPWTRGSVFFANVDFGIREDPTNTHCVTLDKQILRKSPEIADVSRLSLRVDMEDKPLLRDIRNFSGNSFSRPKDRVNW
ncbi:hypothetical protein DPMN_170825 [Dreissena polymorpha]|uniref:Uncharacterized protein n=1 Tax=Dreissena polymorpha TaxID=45954 RepID=A0A9D4IEL5_DREPO|nr:hypothetical protein DPMN_170825 [Dreissena polymorpha]